MAELGIIAAVAQIADVGLRLSIKLYTFGEIVASADRSVISISKDVSLTSGVLKELGQTLDKDRETRTLSENAVQTADGVVKECLEVFQEMDNILMKKLPGLGGRGKEGRGGERVKRATVMLERLKWGYLQPKLQLLRSNLERLKSTLLLMLNVITYAKQVSEKTESPSVIAEQRSLIQDLAHSNQEYIRKFENLSLGIEGLAVEDAGNASKIGALEREVSTETKPLPPARKRKLETMNFAVPGTPLQNKENIWGPGSNDPTTATRSFPKDQSSMTGSLATPPNAGINNLFINTSGQSEIAMPPVQEQRILTTEVPREFKLMQLKRYSTLIQNLLKVVDEAQDKITFESRSRMKGGIADLHERERRELEKMWGFTAPQEAEQRLDSLAEGVGELPTMNRFAASVTSANVSPYMAESFKLSPLSPKDSFADTDKSAEWPPPGPYCSKTAAPASTRPLSASIDPSSTYVDGEMPGTDLSHDQSSYQSSYQDRVARSKRPPAFYVDEPGDTVAVKRARRSHAKCAEEGGISAVPDPPIPGSGDEVFDLGPAGSGEDILENFDFENYMADGDFQFDPSTFEPVQGIELQSMAKREGPFAGLQGCIVGEGGTVEDKHRNKVGVLVYGNAEELVGQTVREDSCIVSEHGKIVGRATLYEEPKEELVMTKRLRKWATTKGSLLPSPRPDIMYNARQPEVKPQEPQGQLSRNGPPLYSSATFQASLIPGRMLSTCKASYSELDSSMADSSERESGQAHSRLGDMEVVDRLVSLWTTVKL